MVRCMYVHRPSKTILGDTRQLQREQPRIATTGSKEGSNKKKTNDELASYVLKDKTLGFRQIHQILGDGKGEPSIARVEVVPAPKMMARGEKKLISRSWEE